MRKTDPESVSGGEVGVIGALRNGSAMVALSAVICGWGCLIRKQFVKGALFLAGETAIIAYMIKIVCK